MLIGYIAAHNEHHHKGGEADHTWKDDLLDTSNHTEAFLRFVLGTIIIAGSVLRIGYQAYGMAGIPMLLIRGTKSLETENDDLKGSIHSVREQLRTIQEKYQKKFSVKSNISEKDKVDLKRLRKEEKILSNK